MCVFFFLILHVSFSFFHYSFRPLFLAIPWSFFFFNQMLGYIIIIISFFLPIILFSNSLFLFFFVLVHMCACAILL